MTVPTASKKRPAISITSLLVIVGLAVVAYFAAPKVMTYIMLQQESAKANSAPVAPASFGERPEGLSIGGGSPAAPESPTSETPTPAAPEADESEKPKGN